MTYVEHAQALTELAWCIHMQDDKIKLLESNKRYEHLYPFVKEKTDRSLEIAKNTKNRLIQRYEKTCKQILQFDSQDVFP